MRPRDFNKIISTAKKQTSIKANSLLPGTNNLIVSQDIQIDSFRKSYMTHVNSPVSYSTQSSLVVSKMKVSTPKDLKTNLFTLNNNKNSKTRNEVYAFPFNTQIISFNISVFLYSKIYRVVIICIFAQFLTPLKLDIRSFNELTPNIKTSQLQSMQDQKILQVKKT
jgi:hypothetical protein